MLGAICYEQTTRRSPMSLGRPQGNASWLPTLETQQSHSSSRSSLILLQRTQQRDELRTRIRALTADVSDAFYYIEPIDALEVVKHGRRARHLEVFGIASPCTTTCKS